MQAVYDKLLEHHKLVSERFKQMGEHMKEDSRKVLKEAEASRDALLLALGRALNTHDDLDQEAQSQRERLEKLLEEMQKKRDALVDAWASLQNDSNMVMDSNSRACP
jgi:hypothetical protein